MKINFFSFFIILCLAMPTTQCIKLSKFLPPLIGISLLFYTAPHAEASSNAPELPKPAKYDCQQLKAKYSLYAHLLPDKKDLVFDAALQEWLTVRGKHYLPERLTYAKKHTAEQEALSETLACLVCEGVNPNRVVVSNVACREAYGSRAAHEIRDYLCALDYAVDTDNAELASFLIKHNASTHTHVLTWFASVKDRFFGEPPKYAWTITREQREHLQSKIRSVAMAKLLEPHYGIRNTFAEPETVAHRAAENNEFGSDLLHYYLEQQEELADTPDKNGNTPLHRLASTCWYAYGAEEREKLDSKANVLAQKTKKINALNAQGKTALDIALSKPVDCESFITLVKAYGGKSTSTKQHGTDDYEILERE